MEHARALSRPRACESPGTARHSARRGQGLPCRFWPVAATGLLPPDPVAILVGESGHVAGPLHLPLHGISRDGRPADHARAPGAAARDRHAAGEEESAIRQALADTLPRRLGRKIATARDAARGAFAEPRAVVPVAEAMMAPRAQYEQQPSEIGRFPHESGKTQGLCRSREDPRDGTYVAHETRRPRSRKECPIRDGRLFRACGRSRRGHHYG